VGVSAGAVAEALRAENLFLLRRQLALYIERGVQPRRVDSATRVSLVVLARLFDWRGGFVVVQPATLIVGIAPAGDCSGE